MRLLALVLATMLMAGCSNTRLAGDRSAAYVDGYKLGRLMVVTAQFPEEMREPMETEVVEALRGAGVDAVRARDLLSEAEFKAGGLKETLSASRARKADSMLLLSGHYVDTKHFLRFSQVYGGGYTMENAQTASTKFLVSVYDLQRETVVWSGGASNQRGSLVKPAGFAAEVASTVVAELGRDGLLPQKP